MYYDDLSFTYRGKGHRERKRERERERGWDMRINDIYFLAKYTSSRFHKITFLPWSLINVNSDRARIWLYGDKIKIKYWRKKLIPKMFINIRKIS